MVVLNRIYTRTGDGGTTALATGARRPKHDLRVAAYGTVDETNACLGLARLHTAAHEVDPMLGAHPERPLRPRRRPRDAGDRQAACPTSRSASSMPRSSGWSARSTGSTADLAPLRSFVLPGGTPAAAALHLARTVCRRAERLVVELAGRPDEPVSPAAVKYLNRLSDFLFVAARSANDKGALDVLWVPGQNR